MADHCLSSETTGTEATGNEISFWIRWSTSGRLAQWLFVPSLVFLFVTGSRAANLDLHNARISSDANLSGPERKGVEMLVQEVEKRTGLDWFRAATRQGPLILIHHMTGSGPTEGFRVSVQNGVVDIQGNDERGTLFGIGYFLRQLRWDRGSAEIPDGLNVASSPKYRLRGHQIGYRPKVNTYDAWTPEVFEQYVRELAVFGTNAIELIPPRSDDDDESPHFHLPKIEMMERMSRIIADYGLQVWIWYPAMDKDYSDPQTVEFALNEWGEVFRKLPRVDAIYVPGGDPGHTRPKVLMAFLEKEARVLRKYHPKAQLWVSPQAFDTAWLEEFVGILKTEPRWLDGVIYGPWVRVPPAELRAKVPGRYPIRLCPDITHSIRCEYPVPGWDRAYAVTEGRETINPRPVDEAKIFRFASPASSGFVTYSEGVNDDLNKFVWSSLGWNPDEDLTQILREYARYFINPKFADSFAQGLLSLERNWRGPLLTNSAVDTTMLQFLDMERSATPQMLLNWRFQQGLYRAYYDSYIRQRLAYESLLEQRAMDRLSEAGRIGSMLAMDEAERILDAAVTKPVGQNLRDRVFALGEALYQSIGMQLSADRYRAIAVSRGANLDTVDFPLNSRFWLKKQFAELRKREKELDRLAGIDAIVNRTNPGPGGFYDDLGNVTSQPHLVETGPGYDRDPGRFRSVGFGYAGFGGGFVGRSSVDAIRVDGPARFLETPTSFWDWAETRYETPLTMHYEQLDPQAHYKLRVMYVVHNSALRVRLVANETMEVHPWLQIPNPMRPVDFDVPDLAVETGSLTLRWFNEPGGGGFDSAVQIAEVFLLRR